MAAERVPESREESIRKALLAWYDRNARDLPWRRTRDPYAIWVSEIMLQQTRVNAVLEHYREFLGRFPTVAALASADEGEVLTAWSGLGYYRRAKFLHRAARCVVEELGGVMPNTVAGLRLLPGVGEYTAAAIGSIAFGEQVAVVDGNVERVVMRLAGFGEERQEGGQTVKATIRQTADAMLDHARPGEFNQAMMELGATVCLPRNPLCLQCPLLAMCTTQGEHPKSPRRKMQRKEVWYALVERRKNGESGEIYLERRPPDVSLMPGMWELPEADGTEIPGSGEVLALRHAITNTNYDVKINRVPWEEAWALPPGMGDRRWVKVKDLHQMPLTGLSRKALRALRIMPGSQAQKAKGAGEREPQ